VSTNTLKQDFSDLDIFTRIVESIRTTGYSIVNPVFTYDQLNLLYHDISGISASHFHRAGIGRELDEHIDSEIRSDQIYWLDRNRIATRFYWDWMEQLRNRINQALFLGLFDYECMYAHYPQGAFYKKHLDAFSGSENRKLSTVLYLNPDWQHDDGGELIFYAEDDSAVLARVAPYMGTLVIFLSEIFPHEVLAARRSRYSLTGWFRINATTSIVLDPPR